MKSKLFGILFLIETAALLAVAFVSWYYHDPDRNAFLITAATTGLLGVILLIIGNRSRKSEFRQRDSFFVVSLSWVLMSAFGMIPFLLCGSLDAVGDAFFETMSGFTATGFTTLHVIDGQPHGILLWRSLTQWLGGLGIIVFTLAFVPSIAKGSRKMSMFAAEAPGISIEKLSPTMQGTARILWIIYIVLTVVCTLFYWMGPMDLFDAVCHSMTTIATGGFSTHNACMGYFQSRYLEYVGSFFMLISSLNFSIHYFFAMRRFDVVRKNEEMRAFVLSVVIMAALFFALFYLAPVIEGTTEQQIAAYPQGAQDKFCTSLFHVVNVFSSTGYQARYSNYDNWGILFLIPTVLMMIVGGCAGSTSGGIKMARVLVLFKFIKNEIRKLIHPTGIYSVKISDQSIGMETLSRVCVYMAFYLMIMVFSTIALSALGIPINDAMISIASCFSNFGIGSGATGPTACIGDLPAAAKWILSFVMLAGRLEIFTVLILFTRSFWKTN